MIIDSTVENVPAKKKYTERMILLKVSNNLGRHRSENNFVGPSK